MKSAFEYQTTDTYPRIVAVDFTQLNTLDLFATVDRTGMREKQRDFSCEVALAPLAATLLEQTI